MYPASDAILHAAGHYGSSWNGSDSGLRAHRSLSSAPILHRRIVGVVTVNSYLIHLFGGTHGCAERYFLRAL